MEPRQRSCAISTAGQASEACLCLLHSQLSVLGRGSVQVAWSLGERCPVHPCLCHSACACTGVQREGLCASPVCARCARGRRYGGPAGRSPPCAHLSFAGVSAPGHAVMVWEKRLAQPVPHCLVFCWPFNTLGSASVESHRKVAAALVSPGPSWCTGERSGGISEERT